MKNTKNKMILGLTVTALIFASCSRDEVSSVNTKDPNVITLDPTTGKTRAYDMTLTGLHQDDEGFGVFATSASTPTFIDNRATKYQYPDWIWIGQPNIYWPRTEDAYPIGFYAYYPRIQKDMDGIIYYTAPPLTDDLKIEYTIPLAPAEQVDLLAANQPYVITRPASGNVNLDFKHILSRIDFKVKTDNHMNTHVQSIAIKNVGNKGTFDYSDLSWSTPPSVFETDYYYMEAPIHHFNSFHGVGGFINGSHGSFILMPQNLSGRAWDLSEAGIATDAYIEVVYRVDTYGENLVGYTNAEDHPHYDVSEHGHLAGTGLYVKVGFPLPTNWQMNKYYVYTLFLGVLETSGGYLVSEFFIDEDGNEVDFPVIDPGTEEEIDITEPINKDKPIGFNVDAESWTIVPDINVQ